MTTALPSAVLWDMDGTLVDTEPYWMAAEGELVHAWGGTWTHEDGLQVVGSGLSTAALVFQSRGVDLPVDDIVAILSARVREQVLERVPWRPGARELLAEVRAAGIPTALVTMSYRELAEDVIAGLGEGAFDATVTGDEVVAAKPDPEAYLRAAQLLGVAIEDCVALEDSAPGIASAVSSGAVSIAVPLHVPLPESPSYTSWSTLEGKGLEQLLEVWSGVRV